MHVAREYSCNDRLFPSTTNIPSVASSSFSTSTSTSALNHDAAGPVSASANTGKGCCGDGPTEAFDDLHSGPFLPQVLLIDAGCEYRGGYASDVTRTIPVGNGGKFTSEGREIYSIVLRMQKVSRFCLISLIGGMIKRLRRVACTSRKQKHNVNLECIGMNFIS